MASLSHSGPLYIVKTWWLADTNNFFNKIFTSTYHISTVAGKGKISVVLYQIKFTTQMFPRKNLVNLLPQTFTELRFGELKD